MVLEPVERPLGSSRRVRREPGALLRLPLGDFIRPRLLAGRGDAARPNQPVSSRAITRCACERGNMGNLMNDDDLPQGLFRDGIITPLQDAAGLKAARFCLDSVFTFTALIVVWASLALGSSPAAAQNSGVETAGHLSILRLSELETTDVGVEADVIWPIASGVAVDSSFTWFPAERDDVNAAALENQHRALGLIGVRAIGGSDDVELFARGRAGFLRFGEQGPTVASPFFRHRSAAGWPQATRHSLPTLAQAQASHWAVLAGCACISKPAICWCGTAFSPSARAVKSATVLSVTTCW